VKTLKIESSDHYPVLGVFEKKPLLAGTMVRSGKWLVPPPQRLVRLFGALGSDQSLFVTFRGSA
jgi:hypothetical protein